MNVLRSRRSCPELLLDRASAPPRRSHHNLFHRRLRRRILPLRSVAPHPSMTATSSIYLPVRRQRHLLQYHDRLRRHIFRQPLPQAASSILRPSFPSPTTYPTSRLSPLSSSLANTTRCFTYRCSFKHRLYLSQLDSVSSQLHLLIRSSQNSIIPIPSIPPHISRPIQPLSFFSAIRIRHEPLRRSPVFPDTLSPTLLLRCISPLSLLLALAPVLIQDVHLRVRYRRPDRHASLPFSPHLVHATPHHRLRRPIFIDQSRPWRSLLQYFNLSPLQRFSSYHQRSSFFLPSPPPAPLAQHLKMRRRQLHQALASLSLSTPRQSSHSLLLIRQSHAPSLHQRPDRNSSPSNRTRSTNAPALPLPPSSGTLPRPLQVIPVLRESSSLLSASLLTPTCRSHTPDSPPPPQLRGSLSTLLPDLIPGAIHAYHFPCIPGRRSSNPLLRKQHTHTGVLHHVTQPVQDDSHPAAGTPPRP